MGSLQANRSKATHAEDVGVREMANTKMKNKAIEWLKNAGEKEKPFIRMVVGWQRVVVGINASVEQFNDKLFVLPDERDAMKLLSAKLFVVAAMQEIKELLDKWQGEMRKLKASTTETDALRIKNRNNLNKINGFRNVRNLVFHFADPITDGIPDADKLVELYESIDAHDLNELNTILRSLIEVGEQMRIDAMAALAQVQ